MEKIYIESLKINKVRHLKKEVIELSKDSMKHLILTGKNGSGKTSVLEALSLVLDLILKENLLDSGKIDNSIAVKFNASYPIIKSAFECGEIVLAYYKDERKLHTNIPKHVEKVELKEYYGITEEPRKEFVKYLLDMKMTEALAANAGKKDKANGIRIWFEKFENILKDIYMDEEIKLYFNEETFEFSIIQNGREPFGFNELSGGFAAILDIVIDLMIRMENHIKRPYCYDVPGIVLIDEIETHLHLELQKKIMDILTNLFPNIQFIVSTHSPFVLNSISNTTIYDLEKKITVQDGLDQVSYDGIVESYFDVDRLSDDMRNRFERYKKLISKKNLSDDDFCEISELELYLNEIPDYLMLDISTEFQKCKAMFEMREDI